jgi:3-hydroxyacyl-CoA dehydrogenase/enoyl-CoA hydratase/3-hydroxybutyryl-CoA epimerase
MTTVTMSAPDSKKPVRLAVSSDGPVNTIDSGMMASLEALLKDLGGRGAAGIILESRKKGSFITGADMMELFAGGPEGVAAALRRMHAILKGLAGLEGPLVAVLDDQAAIGGGFELLLLVCDHIVATPRSSFGLPEVHFGLVPALGGLYPLARVAGLEMALNMVTRGRTLRTEELAAAGLATACSSEELMEKAEAWIKEHAKRSKRVASPGSMKVMPESEEERKKIVDGYMERAEISPQRPWLPAAVRLLALSTEPDFERFFESNLEEFCALSSHPNTKNKIDFFFLKSFVFPKLARTDPKKAAACPSMGMVGSGLMGAGIAQVAADAGIKVRLMDMDEKIARGAVDAIAGVLQGLVKRGRWTEKRMKKCLANIEVVKGLEQMKDVPLLIEAIPEKMELKQKLAGDVHGLSEDIIFATNTSSLPIGDISKGTSRPDRVVGMHFFSPVPLMELLEVIEGRDSSEETVATAMALGKAMGKTCILVGDGPGFYTSRVFATFLYGGFLAVEAGADPWETDRVAVRAGFPRGPLHMFCSVGGMIPYHAGKFMETREPGRLPVPAAMASAAEAGYVGAGGKKGFYRDEAGKIPDESVLDHLARKKGLPVPGERDIEDILLLGMVNEAFWVLGEGILRDLPSMDLGAVLGVGFPDCFHGPARYASMRGLAEVVSRCRELHEKYQVPHMAPAPELVRMTACGVRGSLI